MDKDFKKEDFEKKSVRKEQLGLSQDTEAVEGKVVDRDFAKKILSSGGNIVIGTLNIVSDPLKRGLSGRREKFYKKSSFHFWMDILLVLALVSIFSIFIIISNFEPRPEVELKSSLLGEAAVSGDLSVFEVYYKNNGKSDIDDVSLSLVFPDNFRLVSVQPENSFSDQNNTFNIGSLPRGANGKVNFSGLILGRVGDSRSLAYSLNYSQDNKRHNTLGSLLFPIKSSSLSVVLEMPEKIYKGVDFGAKVLIKNEGRLDVDRNIEFVFDGEALEILSVSGARADLINKVAVWDGLRAGESAEIELSLSPNSYNATTLSLLTFFDLGLEKSLQVSTQKNVLFLDPSLKVSILPLSNFLKNGEATSFKIVLENSQGTPLRDLRLNFSAADSAFSLKDLSLPPDSGFSLSGTVLSLDDLAADARVEVNVEALLNRKTVNPNQETGLAVDIGYSLNGEAVSYKAYSPKLKVVSDLQVLARAVYYSAQGDQLGVGPLPPAVDVPTRYWVFFEAENHGNDLKDFMFSAQLPDNVGWTDQKSLLSGQIRYAPIGRRVVWNVDKMPKEGGQYRAGFEIELIPLSSDLGKTPDLLRGIEYSVFDDHASVEVSGSLENLDADLKFDNMSSGKGKVIKMNVIR